MSLCSDLFLSSSQVILDICLNRFKYIIIEGQRVHTTYNISLFCYFPIFLQVIIYINKIQSLSLTIASLMSLQQSLSLTNKHKLQNQSATQDDQILTSWINQTQSYKNFDGHLSYTKENTHEATLEQVKKQIKNAKKQKVKLNEEFQNVTSQMTQTYLKELLAQLNCLSKENQDLRCEYKKATKNSVRQTSPLQTPRARKSTNTIISRKNTNAQSKISEYKFNSSSKKGKQNKERMSFQPNIKLQQSQMSCMQQFSHSVANFGRSSLPNQRPFINKKSQQKQHCENAGNLRCMNWQSTERKNLMPISQSNNAQNNFSLSQIFNHQNNSSYDSQSRVICHSFNEQITIDCNAPNIFLDFINTIVEQQRQMQRQIVQDINMGVNYQIACKGIEHQRSRIKMINDLQIQVNQTQLRIGQLESLYKKYQDDIKTINSDISIVNQNVLAVAKQKEKDMVVLNEVKKRSKLVKDFKQKEAYYKYLIGQKNNNKNLLPQSLKAIMMMLSGRSTQQPAKCVQIIRQSIRNPRQFNIQRKSKQNKLKVLMESIEQGRKKFNQLMEIYNGRIKKIEDKISKYTKSSSKNPEGTSQTHR